MGVVRRSLGSGVLLALCLAPLLRGAAAIRFVIDREECFSHNVDYEGDTVHVSPSSSSRRRRRGITPRTAWILWYGLSFLFSSMILVLTFESITKQFIIVVQIKAFIIV